MEQTFEKYFQVTQGDTALSLTSGGLEVLATPRLVAWMENVAFDGVEPFMGDGETTVGTSMDISHLAATAVGGQVRVVAELTKTEKRLFTFQIEAYDNTEKIAQATHQRVKISIDRFLSRVNDKLN
ncbi:thioesterase family protein [Eubacteriaceae bacterium ES3]|nr:thioesterase family protein [Eubacteriaceae bacterium ES3]